MSFSLLFSRVDEPYDIVLIDVAPSITLMQTCAMVYAQRVLIPVSMDTLSLQGAGACLETARMMNELFRVNVQPVALLPVMVDKRFQHTAVMMKSLEDLSAKFKIPLLAAIRTDVTVSKCGRARQFLADYDPKCKAMEDYQMAGAQLLELLSERADQSQSAGAQAILQA
jgi:chromosome partitioning protein